MKKRVLLGFLALSVLSCIDKPEAGFSLVGKTNGIETGTVLYLQNTLTYEIIDSVTIMDNAFNLQNALPEEPLQVILRTSDYSHYRYLWIESNTMTFDASESDFRNAIVTGSGTEELSQTLISCLDSFPRVESRLIEQEFIHQHPNSIVSANILSVYSTTWGKEKTEELFSKFSEENKNSVYGVQIARYIELNKDPKIGDAFVDFEMEDQHGNPQKLSDTKGKAILLEFWASWCGPCRRENPNLVKTYEVFHPTGFEIIAVSLDENKESWVKAIEEDSLHWDQVSDLKGQGNEASLIYGISGIPDNFLIDENGIIVGRNLRGEELVQKLKEILY